MNYSPSAAPESGLIELLAQWKASPSTFVRDALGATPEPWQHDALEALPKHKRIAIRSGHGIGKSAMLAWAILWFGFTRQDGKIPSTAPTSHQLEDVLAAEVRKWADRMRARGWGYFTRQLSITQEAIRFPSGTFAALRTATKDRPEALQGSSARRTRRRGRRLQPTASQRLSSSRRSMSRSRLSTSCSWALGFGQRR